MRIVQTERQNFRRNKGVIKYKNNNNLSVSSDYEHGSG